MYHPTRSRAQLEMLLLLWPLAFCSLQQSHAAFPFPVVPFFGPSYTNQQDVEAVNGVYASLGWPDLRGWVASGGDPCEEAWQGVQCLGPNITAIELGDAGLEGKLSEALGKLTAITKLDLSSNNISGGLPDSMAKLKSLSELHVQNNRLSGTLAVLRDLPLKDLNVENNLFSGPIPEKLLSIPNFLRNGNHFTILPITGSSPASSSPPPPSAAHPHITVISDTPQDDGHGDDLPRHGKKVSPANAAGFSVLAAGSLTIAVLVIVFAVSRRRRERSLQVRYMRGVERSTPSWVPDQPPRIGAAAKPEEQHTTVCPGDYAKAAGSSVHPSLISMSSIVSGNKVQESSEGDQSLRFPFKLFTVASLQQSTNSFSDQNLMRETRFGKIYLAEHPESKFAVLKLCDTAAKMADDEFLKNVQSISGIRHPNVEELVGCCVEHGQRLLVYKHFSDRTLDDVIHGDDDEDSGDKFPWDARVGVALEAAEALEHLHDGGGRREREAVVHGHFRPEHVLVGDGESETRVRVSGCGLAPFAPPSGASEWCEFDDALSYAYDEPPEEAAATMGGDVYSFGVVMLQLLTGRRTYDGARPRGERRLVPWASARLHDLNALRRMADPRLLCHAGTPAPAPVPVRSLSRFADIISRCVQREAEFRPAMAEVVQDLSRAMEEAPAAAAERASAGAEELV